MWSVGAQQDRWCDSLDGLYGMYGMLKSSEYEITPPIILQ